MAESDTVNYKGAAKTTALFSVVQIIKLAVGLIRNKFVAILLGPEGMGIIGIYHTYAHFVQSGAGLGLSQSAVRDVSEANGTGSRERFSRIISLTNKLVLFTALLGLVVTIIFSPFFSQWGFGNYKYTLSFILLSVSVAGEIFVENRLAILKGMRRMRSLAITSIIASIVGLVTSIPIFYFWGEKGIVPSLLVASFVSVLSTNYFVNKIKYDRVNLSFKEIMHEGMPMLKMGVALMSINFLGSLFHVVIASYLSRKGGIDTLGLYRAGHFLMINCFSLVLTAMNTDYYPRICAVHSQTDRLNDEVNAQTRLGLVLVFPIAIAFISYASIFIPLLYSDEFLGIVRYTDIAIFGTILSVPSNCIAMVLLAKQDAKAFTTISLIINIVNTGLYIGLFELFGLVGLGIAYALNVLIQLLTYTIVIKRRFQISFKKNVLAMDGLMLLMIALSVCVKMLGNVYLAYTIETLLVILACLFSGYQLKEMGIKISDIVSKIIKKRK